MATLSGVWVFDDTLSRSSYSWPKTSSHDDGAAGSGSSGSTMASEAVNFTSGGTSFTSMRSEARSGYFYGGLEYHQLEYENRCVYTWSSRGSSVNTWGSPSYQTVDFGETEQTVTSEFYSWFTSDASRPIRTTLANCTALESNPTAIRNYATQTLTFTANAGYILPNDVTVSGASYTWDKTTGKLTLSRPTNQVFIEVTAILNKKFTRLYLGEIVKTIGNKVFRKLQTTEYVLLPTLTSPTVELSETTLNIYDEEGLATSYDILVDGEVKATVEKVSLISFTLDGRGYQAEEGMTWGDWVTNTAYNTGDYVFIGSSIGIYGVGSTVVYPNTNTPVKKDEPIQAGVDYEIVYTSND